MVWEFLKNKKTFTDADAATKYVQELYDKASDDIIKSFKNFCNDKPYNFKTPASYPYVGITVQRENLAFDPHTSFGIISEPGNFGTTLTTPHLFYNYYRNQFKMLLDHHKLDIHVGYSNWPIPLPFLPIEHNIQLSSGQVDVLSSKFQMPDLKRINDDIANSRPNLHHNIKPLALFTAERVDFSLQRLHHYTGTAPEHFQDYVLLTNYQRYIDAFVGHFKEIIESHPEKPWEIVGPGDIILVNNKGEGNLQDDDPYNDRNFHQPQMPAYHFKKPGQKGVTIINIGVGPSNAKTITDHLSVLRPHCWVMLGHCAGLRNTQQLGDYVLADGYVRDDKVLDKDLPTWVPVPPMAEVQQAMQQAITEVVGGDLKSIVRTGTVHTTDNRNWELRTKQIYEQFCLSRAIAVDMESATIAANGFRFRVPYGTLLCVSDKPIHGVIKLRSMANNFYRNRIKQHLMVGLRAMEIIADTDVLRLHSRKLRGFDECPMR